LSASPWFSCGKSFFPIACDLIDLSIEYSYTSLSQARNRLMTWAISIGFSIWISEFWAERFNGRKIWLVLQVFSDETVTIFVTKVTLEYNMSMLNLGIINDYFYATAAVLRICDKMTHKAKVFTM
jgi:hypothetical protein